MQVGIIGINHRLADLKLRELLAKACERRFKTVIYPNHTSLLLSTCNRTEIYFSSADLADTHSNILDVLRQEVLEPFDTQLYSFFGLDCFTHLSKVTAGLDSACVAETEIQGQVKNAYEWGRFNQKLPSDLHYLFQKSLAIGKHVRSSLHIPSGLPTFEDALYEMALQHLPQIHSARVLFVGASAINKNLINFFKSKNHNLSLYSKSKQNLSIPLIQNLSEWESFDAIIFGSKSTDYLIKEAPSSHKLVFDLSVPRNVDPSLSSLTLYNIDDVQRHLISSRQTLEHLLEEGQSIIHTLSKRHFELYQNKIEYKLKIAAMIA